MFFKKKGFTLVEIMIVVAIIALLAAIAIPNLLRSRLNAAEANAQATLKTMATAAESFAAANGGVYPTAITDLTDATPPYLNEDYTTEDPQSYDFTFTAGAGSTYEFSAVPTGAYANGGHAYSVCTGAVMCPPTGPTEGGASAPGCPCSTDEPAG
jgi:prepilin-type N-terminal cleavage/methylation domain-containing protein